MRTFYTKGLGKNSAPTKHRKTKLFKRTPAISELISLNSLMSSYPWREYLFINNVPRKLWPEFIAIYGDTLDPNTDKQTFSSINAWVSKNSIENYVENLSYHDFTIQLFQARIPSSQPPSPPKQNK